MSFIVGSIIGGVVGVGGLIEGAMGQSSQQNISDQQLQLAQEQFNNQQWYNNKLHGLITDPAAFLKNPLFTSTLNYGTQNIKRQFGPSTAGGGASVPGAELMEIQKFGQSFADQELFQQEQLLAGAAGLGFNPAAAFSGASESQGLGMQELSGGMNTAAQMAYLIANGGGFGGGGGGGGTPGPGYSNPGGYNPYTGGPWS